MKFPGLTQKPPEIRNGIPLYALKTASEMAADPYEAYWQQVLRQTIIHFTLEPYPFREPLDWTLDQLGSKPAGALVDLGCGVGRLVKALAARFPECQVLGLDYSYQMLRQAARLVTENVPVVIPRTHLGWPDTSCIGANLRNAQFVQATAERIPIEAGSADGLTCTFTFDRLQEPGSLFSEAARILRAESLFVLISPQNFREGEHWKRFSRPEQVQGAAEAAGFQLVSMKQWICREPLDAAGNEIQWNTCGWAFQKI